jgi:N-acylneuraminate cytidylyltransferase
MEVISIIPARSGSKGILNKNLQEVGGKNLLSWSINASLRTQNIGRTIVSTDSIEYSNLATELGAEVPFIRPADLARDSSPDIDFIKHAIIRLTEMGARPDLIVHLRPTTPFRDPQIIEQAISEFIISGSRYSALRSVHEMSESAYKTLEIDSEGQLMSVFTNHCDIEQSNMARQSFPTTYSPNGYVDIIATNFVELENKIHGGRVKAFVTPKVIEVDDASDLEYLNVSLEISQTPYQKVFGGIDE